MTQLQQNRYDQLLRRVGDLKGPGSKVNDALTELFPMIDVENVPPELLLLYGSRICVGGENLAGGGALTFQQAMLRNPGGSGFIITVTQIRVSSTDAQRIVYGPSTNTLTNARATAFSDGRVFGEGTVGQCRDEAPIVVGPTFGQARLLVLTDAIIDVPRGLGVLSPGTAFSVSTTVADTGFTYAFHWVERVAQPSELNL